ncbi:protein kinase domain-containing protein [Rhodococcus koreensis]
MAADDAAIAQELDAEGFSGAEAVGRGGFGVVFRCLQRALDRTVAVKVLTTDLSSDNLDRFLREQRALGRLSGHPHIVDIYGCGVTRTGRPYLAMRYCGHGTLESTIRRCGPLAWSDTLALGVKVCGALETAHRLGTLHRDVKPANILINDYDEPLLADFGIARIIGGFETSTGIVTGSPAYTAPEVLHGRSPTPEADVYSLGATLFCAVTGHAAFERRDGEQLVAQFLRITRQPVPDLRETGIPQDVCAAIEHAMASSPDLRPATAADFGAQLRQAQQHHDLTVIDMALPSPARRAASERDLPEATAAAPRPLDSGSLGHPRDGRTPIVPTTKYRPPSPNRRLVERDRLLDALRAGKGRHLTVIHAPAGYGKTTVASQWREVLTGEGTPTAWLSVDHDDNNVVWFLSHLVEAIRQVRPALARELGQVLEEHGDEAERYVLSTLINEIHRSGEAVAVVLDDWHRVDSPQTHAAMAFLLDNCCHHVQVIVTSRTRVGLPLSRMKVRNELLEIDAAALRFDPAESRSFLIDLAGLPLEQRDVENLTDSTDGWAAALQLASLSLRGCNDPATMIGRLSGRHQAIGEFLAENVLDTLEPELLDFLMATAVTGRLCGSLASALARIPDGRARLEEVERRDLFLRQIDDEGEWFRYHHLFAEFLCRRLERDQPDRIPVLHRTAAHWFAEHRYLTEAVDHALAAGDERVAVGLVEDNQTYLLEHSQMSTLLGLIDKLPPSLVTDSASLQLALAWANMLLQRTGPAVPALRRVRTALECSGLAAADRESIRIEASVAESALEMYADRIDAIPDLVCEALDRPDAVSPWTVSAAANIKTFVEMNRHRFEAIPALQAWASTYHSRTGGPFSVMYGYAFSGLAAYEQLQIADADTQFTTAVHVARRAGGIHSHAARLAGALLAELRYDQDRIDEAENLVEESYQLGSEGGMVDFMIARYVVAARIKAVRGDLGGADRYLRDGTQAAQSLGLARLRAAIVNERVLLGLPVGCAVELRREAPNPADDGIRLRTAQLVDETAIRLLLRDNATEGVERACTRARQWAAVLEHGPRRRSALQAKRLLAECVAASGHDDEAHAVLADVVAVCAEQGLRRSLLDAGPRLGAMLRDLHEDQKRGLWADVSKSFLAELITEDVDTGVVRSRDRDR